MSVIDSRLAELNIQLPEPSVPVANFVPYVVTGNLVFISGQVPSGADGFEAQGSVGTDVTVEDAAKAARVCALHILAQLKEACGGDLDRVKRCVQLNGFVNSSSGFGDQPKVVNGASDVIVEIFGDKGKHARFAVGSSSLPFDVSVEIAAVFEIA